ncbi:MAG: universal stress protein [Thermodesulfobacteriota bacterium]|nr:universal stress protein [Thermodesulfobacteriota bacterium]
MVKRILIPLDPSQYTENALDEGCNIARRNGAELTGLVILDIPGIEKSIGPIPLGGLYYAEKLEKHKEEEAHERIHSILSRFKEKCNEEEVAHREAEFQGSPSDRIIKESIFYDLVIMGLRTYFNFETSDKPGDSLEKILDHSITPIYGVPETMPVSDTEKTKVLIAFDGSLQSARAMKRFAKLADPDIMEVALIISHTDKETANYYMDQAEAYLNTYSINNVKKIWTSQNIIRVMEEQYLDWADIVVVGAHSKKGPFDFMAGSLVKYLIKEAKRPVFIGQ